MDRYLLVERKLRYVFLMVIAGVSMQSCHTTSAREVAQFQVSTPSIHQERERERETMRS